MSEILEKTENFVVDLLSNKLASSYLYHNLNHTHRVVKSTKELLNFYNLEEAENEIVLLAAWLHDTGYTEGSVNHEETSCDITRNFLGRQAYDEQKIDRVCSLIMASKRFHEPQNLLEEIIRDADCSHFGKKSYMETSELLREELEILGLAAYSQKEWRETNLKMLQTDQRFYTDYALQNWQEEKNKNIRRLIKGKNADENLVKKEKLKAKYKSESPDRGIQTLFRVTLKNHLMLSDIADTKANILLSV